MAVKISKLWGNNTFNNLTNNSKLFYIYLVTNPSISSVGVLSINLPVASAQVGLTIEELRSSTKELISNGYLYVKQYNNNIYFITPEHFNTLSKSDSAVMRVTKDLDALPAKLREFLDSIHINILGSIVKFVKPTEKEVLDYAMSQGYSIDASYFINYYDNEAKRRNRVGVWINGRGKVVRDWKATLRNVWFRDENKLKECKGAPKGFEYMYVESGGKMITPDGWKDGKPFCKDFLKSKTLLRHYNELINK
jgi:hypothetical protein